VELGAQHHVGDKSKSKWRWSPKRVVKFQEKTLWVAGFFSPRVKSEDPVESFG
jgi:hypothetical protein